LLHPRLYAIATLRGLCLDTTNSLEWSNAELQVDEPQKAKMRKSVERD
jgi:hypothetical protein